MSSIDVFFVCVTPRRVEPRAREAGRQSKRPSGGRASEIFVSLKDETKVHESDRRSRKGSRGTHSVEWVLRAGSRNFWSDDEQKCS